MGENSLILIGGGKEWKGTRKVVSGAFTVGAVRAGREAVGECAVKMVEWLKDRVDSSGDDDDRRQWKNVVRGNNKSKKVECVCLEVEEFFKLFSLDVFGRVALDYDFECFKKATTTTTTTTTTITTTTNTNSSSTNDNDSHNSNNDQTTFTRFASPPEAAAFEYLERDIGIRAHPQNLLNPLTQWYWMPTRHNWEYHKNLKMVNTLMEGVIGSKLDKFLEREEERSSSELNGKKKEVEEDNVITMLIEQYYHSPNGNKQSRSSSSLSSNTTRSSSCPFSSSSSFPQSNNNNHKNNTTKSIPTKMTKSQRNQIITNVSQVLHTLLVAGYETTAVSLSYTMHCLSQHPRVQDRACEEARRVLGHSSSLENNNHFSVQEVQQQQLKKKFNEEELPYCKAVIMEAMRLHVPVVFTTRSSAKDITLDMDDEGNMVTIPKGTRFIINPTMVHVDERNFEQAGEFIPERWVRWEDGRWVDRDFELEKKMKKKSSGFCSTLDTDTTTTTTSSTPSPPPPLSSSLDNDNNDGDEKYAKENAQADKIPAANPQSFFAFSDGARNCIGRRLAIMETTIFVAVLLRDMCVDWAVEGFEMEKERRFVIIAPKNLPIAFWKRDD